MLILGYESSCDDTGVALYDAKTGKIDHIVHNQNATHALYGGVVPELASRDHIKKCLPLTQLLLERTGATLSDIDGIAYTAGPGLLGAILVSATLARSLAWSLNIPSLGVHHLEGHLLAPMLEDPRPSYPFIALLVSGGHTQLIQVNGLGQYRLLGDTLDDAVGEAFDKTAKLLGLPYPGGAALSALAERGDAARFQFPRPMTQRSGLEFSFSGLKTCAAQLIARVVELDVQTRCDIAAAFQLAIVDTLVIKCRRALEITGLTRLVVSGGVSANHLLRTHLTQLVAEHSAQVFFPRLEFCTDNAAMIAYVGACRLQAGECDRDNTDVRARWPLEELAAPIAKGVDGITVP